MDNIVNSNSDTLISGTEGNDSISNYGDNVTIQALGGDDTVYNMGEETIIDGGDGSDSISNYSPQGVLTSNLVSINAGAGDDTIRNEHAYNVTLVGGEGNDKIIVVIGDHTTIDGGAGDDTILGELLTSDSSWAMGGYANINGGSGNDYIDPIFSNSASVSGGAGNDTIINEGNASTLNGGAGDDIISLHGASLESDVIKYEVGDGNDLIFGFNETSKLIITSGTEYSTAVSGDDVIINVGENKITISGGNSLSTLNIINYDIPALNINNTADDTLISGTEQNDTIENSGENVTIKSVDGDDLILNTGENISIDGGEGDDSIENSGTNSTILGDYGNDNLSNSAENVLIEGNYGNDVIINIGSTVTIKSGSGNDFVLNTGDNVLFNYDGGNDTVLGFSENSMLSLSSDDYDTLESVRNILVLNGDDLLVLQDAVLNDDTININGTQIELSKVISLPDQEGNDFTIVRNNVSIEGSTDDDKITADGSNISINGGAGDDIISLTSDATNNFIEYATGDGNDTVYGFNDTTKISISGDYSSIKVGNDVIFKVGNDSITAVDAGSVIGEEIVLTEKGTVTVDGKIFELTEDVPNGITITSADNSYTFSHKITEEEATQNNLTDDYINKIFSEKVIVENDDDYTLQVNSLGLRKIIGVSDGATVTGGNISLDGGVIPDDSDISGQYFYVGTDTEGTFTFGDKSYTINGDSNVDITADFYPDKSYASGFENLEGTVSGDFTNDEFYVNGNKNSILIYGDDSIKVVGSSSDTKILDASDGVTLANTGGVSEVHTDSEGVFQFGEKSSDSVAVTVQGDDRVIFKNDSDGDWLQDKEIVGLDEGASLKVSKGGTYLVNESELEVNSGDIIVGLENNRACIYKADRPPITRKTSTTDIIEHFKPKNYSVVSASSRNDQEISLNGGDLAVIESTTATVSITAGDDTVVSQGKNVYVDLTGGNTWLYPLAGKMTLKNYDASTNAGFNLAETDILSAVENGYIDFNNGTLKFGSAQVNMDNRSELINVYNVSGKQQKIGYASQYDSLDLSDNTEDLLLVANKDGSIIGGSGNDTIFANGGNLADGGAGSNFVSISADGDGSNIAVNGKTTVEGFKTGFGNGTDTIYIAGDSPAVDFKEDGLTFYYDNDKSTALKLKDINSTDKFNLYYAAYDEYAKHVFIAEDEWYDVAEGDAKYYVGATNTKNHGIDYSNITDDVNVTLNTSYEADTTFWISNIHSIKGGAGETTITGSDKADTIISGTGTNSIWSAGGNDKMIGAGTTTFKFVEGDGRDSISGFNTANDVIYTENEIADVSIKDNNVVISLNTDDRLTVESVAGSTFNVKVGDEEIKAQVGTNNLTYDGSANYYNAQGNNATLTVAENAGKANIWLNQEVGANYGNKTQIFGNIKYIDGSKSSSSAVLVGSKDIDNKITASKGGSTVWGGGISNDTLIGGNGVDSFYYMIGNGYDIVQNASANDKIILNGITMDQITNTDVTNNSVVLNFSDGGSLFVNSNKGTTFKLGDENGVSYVTDKQGNWTQK